MKKMVKNNMQRKLSNSPLVYLEGRLVEHSVEPVAETREDETRTVERIHNSISMESSR